MTSHPASNKLILAAEELAAYKHYEQSQRTGFQLDFNLSGPDLEYVRALYDPRVIKPGTGKPTMHPIAAVHQRIAYADAYQFAKTVLWAGQPLIEIGPNPANMHELATLPTDPQNKTPPLPGYVHGCCKPDGRDQTRYSTALNATVLRRSRSDDYRNSVSTLINGITCDRFCTKGVGSCDFQAQNAVAVHSLYDVDFDELACAFNRHGLVMLKAWMHFPVELLTVDDFTNEVHRYRFFTRKSSDGCKHDETYFAFTNGDASFGYIHNTFNWKRWMDVGGFDTSYGFSIAIERVNVVGSQFELKISRMTLRSRTHFYIPSGRSDLIGVPDFTTLAEQCFCKNASHSPTYIYTSASKVASIYEFALAREDTARSFNLQTVISYARTKANAISQTNGSHSRLLSEHWDISPGNFVKVCTAIYLLVCWERRVQYKVVQKAQEHAEAADVRKDFWDRMGNKLRRWIEETEKVHLCRHNKKVCFFLGDKKLGCLKPSLNWFHRVSLRFTEDILCKNTTKDHYPREIPYKAYGYREDPIAPLPIEVIAECAQQDKLHHLEWASDIGIEALIYPSNKEAEEKWYKTTNHIDLETALDIGSLTSDGNLAKVIQQARTVLHLNDRDFRKLNLDNMVILEGVPGSGKTSFICDTVIPHIKSKNATSIFITPSSALKLDVQKKLDDTGVRAFTVHSGMVFAARNKVDYIFIDECHTFPMVMLNWFAAKSKVILIGDQHQINFIDFSSHYPDNVPLIEFNLPCQNFMVTKRCPQDVVALPFIQQTYRGIKSLSKVAKSIHFITSGHDVFTRPGATHLTFLQDDKIAKVNAGVQTNTKTVGEVQGCTYPTVILHYGGTLPEKALIDRKQHLVVAFTRHTKDLYICDTTGSDIQRAITDSVRTEVPAEMAGVSASSLVTDNREPVCDSLELLPDDTPYPTCAATGQGVETMLQKIAPMVVRPDYYSVVTTELPAAPGANVSLRLDMLDKDRAVEMKKKDEYVWPDASQRVKITRNVDQFMACKSVLTRLGKATKNLATATARELARTLFAKIEKEFDFDVSADVKDFVFVDFCKKFTERGHDLDDIKEITSWNDQSVKIVENFLKQQQKTSVLVDPLTRDKAGQGISAWSKTLNLQMTIWTRLLEHILVRRSRGRVFITTGMTDLEVLAHLEQTTKPGDRFFSNDWSEFDSSQNNVGRELLRMCLERIGCPADLLSQFMAQLRKRTVVDTFISICAYDKKDSGAPHTLVDNCLFNTAVTLDVLEDFRILDAKGDDSQARGPNIVFNKDRAAWYTKDCGYKFKPDMRDSGEFVSFLINCRGAAYDIPRLAAKVWSRTYHSREDFKNYQTAVGVTLKHNPLSAGLNMLEVNMHHYGGYDQPSPELTRDIKRLEALGVKYEPLTTADFDNALSFLHKFSRGDYPFESLICRPQQQVTIETDIDTLKTTTHVVKPLVKTHDPRFIVEKKMSSALLLSLAKLIEG